MTLDQLKSEIDKLTFEQRMELVAWIRGWEDDEWDKQMAADAAAGKFDRMIAEADRAIDAGELMQWP